MPRTGSRKPILGADEIKKEIEIIKIIKDGNKEILKEYVNNNKIEYTYG